MWDCRCSNDLDKCHFHTKEQNIKRDGVSSLLRPYFRFKRGTKSVNEISLALVEAFPEYCENVREIWLQLYCTHTERSPARARCPCRCRCRLSSPGPGTAAPSAPCNNTVNININISNNYSITQRLSSSPEVLTPPRPSCILL